MNASAAPSQNDPEFLPRLELASVAVVYVPGLLGEPVDQDEAAGVAAWARHAANSSGFGAPETVQAPAAEAVVGETLIQTIFRMASRLPR